MFRLPNFKNKNKSHLFGDDLIREYKSTLQKGYGELSKIEIFFQKLRYLSRQYQYFFFRYSTKDVGSDSFLYRPLISILVPVYNTRIEHLNAMVCSVESQTYKNWELILLDDASPDERPGLYLKDKAEKNSKVRYYRSEKNGGISVATRKALEYASGEYVAFLDHDDRLSQEALSVVVESLQDEKKRPEFLYSDEIFQSKTPGVFSVSAKPAFSPEKLISHNYICHFVVVSRILIEKMGGIREGYDGSQDHEFALRASRSTDRIQRLPYFLYIWRLHGESFSRKKAEVCERSSQKAILEHYGKRNEIVEKIVPGYYPFTYHTIRKLKKVPSVTIYVLGSNLGLDSLYTKILYLIETTSNVRMHFVFGLAGKDSDIVSTWKLPKDVTLHCEKTSYEILNSKEINRIVADTKTEFIFFWNPILIPQGENWLYELLQHAESGGVGAVSPVVVDSKKELLYSSLIFGKNGFIGITGNRLSPNQARIWSGEWIEKNVSALSKNLLLISRKNWDLVQGLDESFQNYYWDVDLSIRLREEGLRLVSNPFSEFLNESSWDCFLEFNPNSSVAKNDRKNLWKKWGSILEEDDFYSPHLDQVGGDRLPKGICHDFSKWLWRRRWFF
ncbi:glycosyltransferase [Leptospira sp. 201903070]|uniref:Glycosyltransferase n=1 Tax=Leptospira ainlahdjerensis TaxID=2810033 RepID=A0ABS2UA74_9LEPT|nr:glycosyltransferase [Leptospira ainlahdjerensis]MBM9577274.1 glycosyltransferase [Leptospira ainlahdjerensis]